MNNKQLKELNPLTQLLVEFAKLNLSSNERVEINSGGLNLIIINEVNNKELLRVIFDFNIVSLLLTRNEITRNEIIRIIQHGLTKYNRFYACPSNYELKKKCNCSVENCTKCWLKAIEDVKFKDEE